MFYCILLLKPITYEKEISTIWAVPVYDGLL